MTLSHEAIWLAIDRLAEYTNLSTSGLARKAGLDPTAFNRSKRISPEGKPRWPSTESLSKILMVTGVSISDFMTFVETRDVYVISRVLRPIAHLPMTKAMSGNYFLPGGFPTAGNWDAVEIAEITPLADNDFTFEVDTYDYEPVYRYGTVLILSSTYDIRRNDRIIVKLKNGDFKIGIFERRSALKLDMKEIMDPNAATLSIPNEDIEWVTRILWAQQ